MFVLFEICDLPMALEITGASRGIGQALAKKAAELGAAELILAGRPGEPGLAEWGGRDAVRPMETLGIHLAPRLSAVPEISKFGDVGFLPILRDPVSNACRWTWIPWTMWPKKLANLEPA